MPTDTERLAPTDDQYRDAAVLLPGVAVGHDATVMFDVKQGGQIGAHVEAMLQAKDGVYIEVMVWVPETVAAAIGK